MQRKQTEPYLSTYLHSKGKNRGLPIGGNFELTARCNFDCPMCYVHLKQEDIDAQGKELTTQQWIDLARDARDQGMVFALLTGGEPFVRKDFFEIYSAMKERGLLVSINSNGSMLSGEIRKKLLENPPMRMNISLYGGCNETYRNMCGVPAFEQVVENIRSLKDEGIDVCINLSVTPYNWRDIGKIYETAETLGIHVRSSSYMYPSIRVNGQYGCGDRLGPKDAAQASVEWDLLRFTSDEFALRAEALMQRQGIEQEGCPVEEGEGVRCRAGSTAFWMTWDGRMLPCGMMTTPVAYPLETGFDAAWEQIRAATAAIKTPGKCVNCSYKDICGACAAVYYTETGTFDGVPEYVCRRAEEIVNQTLAAYEERKQK